MSVTESKAKAVKKSTRKASTVAKDVQALAQVLEQTPIEYVPLSSLVKSPLNVRLIPYSVESVTSLANTIASIGLLQNLVAHDLEGGQFGVAAGGRRLAALNMLVERGVYQADVPVAIKCVPEELAVAASMTENGERKEMHPAEQIVGFRTLADEGKTPAQIGDLLGYSSRHVQRGLKLASLAPALLEALAKDEITLEKCQILVLEDSQERQAQVWEQAQQVFGKSPQNYQLRNLITEQEVSIKNNKKFAFVGSDELAAAGAVVRTDLFSDENEGWIDRALLDRLTLEKLEAIAVAIQESEGWLWCAQQMDPIGNWGEDARQYKLMSEPTPVYTESEQSHIDTLTAALEDTETYDDENDIQQQIEDFESAVSIRGWTAEQKAQSGVVVSFDGGDLTFQRGVILRGNIAQTETPQNNLAQISPTPKGLSATLITSLSSERTLAVMAALVQNPTVALALHTHSMALKVFFGQYASSVLKTSMDIKWHTLLSNAPASEEGEANRVLENLHNQWEARLPENWQLDFSWLLTWDQAEVIALLTYCVGLSLDAVRCQAGMDGKVGGELVSVENALEFDLRDWWQPTKENYFGRISKEQMSEALTAIEKEAQATSVLKMKKGDAAHLAAVEIAQTRWVPECLLPMDETVSLSSTDESAAA
ncbi:ParB/RepB/Spo0J family partition protein [Yersinia enterocolitica]|uniref:ParB/RepB/Spo0J family partition protein n=1 Tax=Yersinia enterocolitica TaxID=630 RepID=UPI001C8D6E57|nr:ParB/RepB/Spo0J family partition protein [Yersinia enterocolitica]MBX9485980.1 ParB/RepB/Spo0J family partition protein [Yersinia enterocolitica]MBX9492179.1 ParB/RepB/Spo0J family partition protein [Yersinia enterocolitica]